MKHQQLGPVQNKITNTKYIHCFFHSADFQLKEVSKPFCEKHK